MRGNVPLSEMIGNEHGLAARLGMRFFGRLLIRPYAFEQAFFLPSARRFRERLRLPLMLLGGLTRFDAMEGALGEGFELVALGRALISDPDLPRRLRAGQLDAARCTPCNRCIVEMERGGTRCVLFAKGSGGDGPRL